MSSLLEKLQKGVGFINEPAPEIAKIAQRQYSDPRPDLQEDSWFWLQMFAGAEDPMFEGILHGFRCMGARILMGRAGGYIIRPTIDPKGEKGWKSQEEYNKDRDQWLEPNGNEIKRLLKTLQPWKKA
jgi:hypothetical protein